MKLPKECPEDDVIYLREYFQENDIESWSLLNLDMALVEKMPGITKQTAHRCLANDLTVIERLFPESNPIRERIMFIRKELKKCNQKANVGLNTFWHELKTGMEKIVIAKRINKLSVEVSSLQLASAVINELCDKKRNLEDDPSSVAKKRRLATQLATFDCAEYEETDNIYLRSGGLSVGTMIKRHAILVHNDYEEGKMLTSGRMKIMVAGLSSVLDLSDCSMESQRSLFTETEWSLLTKFFKKKFPLPSCPVPDYLDDALKDISEQACKYSIEKAASYLDNLRSKSKIDKNERSMLRILDHFVELIDDYQYLLAKDSNKALYTEQDYFRILWSPIFELLFKTHKNIRVKLSESLPPRGSSSEQSQYPGMNNTVRLKADARLVVDAGGKEHDLWAVEVARDDADSKIIDDMSKLIRAGKENVDKLYTTLAQMNIGDDDKVTWIFQISGTNCQISSTHLASDGLYIVLPRFNFDLPSSIDEFAKLYDALEMLLTVKQSTTKTAAHITNTLKERNTSQNLGRFSHNDLDDHLLWMRDTWYTRHCDSKHSTTPFNLFGRGTRNNAERVVVIREDDDECVLPAREQTVDRFGYTKTEDGWFNIYTKKTTRTHPLHDDGSY